MSVILAWWLGGLADLILYAEEEEGGYGTVLWPLLLPLFLVTVLVCLMIDDWDDWGF